MRPSVGLLWWLLIALDATSVFVSGEGGWGHWRYGRAGSNKKQPNIVFVLSDDQGYADVGYHGVSGIKTPNIDALAADGIKLENYYVQPMCSPTRTSLLSGRYTVREIDDTM